MAAEPQFRRLAAHKIHETLQILHCRIIERFPDSGLGRVADDLTRLAAGAGARADRIARRDVLRSAVALILSGILLIVIVALGVRTIHDDGVTDLASFLQTLEAGLGSIFFLGATVFFLVRYDARRAQQRLLHALDELRSFAHVVDMHQLSKNPEKLLIKGEATASSPREDMTPYKLSRYLDYCSEMLALMSKVAAVYVRDSSDAVAISAADDIESLTSGLSRKIWQKIVMLGELSRGDPED